MKRLMILPVLALLFCIALPVSAKVSAQPDGDVQGEAMRGFGEILDLWREGKYEELYWRTITTGKHSKESFIGKLASCERRPACCWEKVQDATITARYAGGVVIHARVGMEGQNGSTKFETKKFKLYKEDDLWKIAMNDLLSLAGNGKRKTRRHYSSKKAKTTAYYRF